MSIIAKYKFDKSIYADLLPEFNAEFTSDKYNTTDEEVDGIITRTIESDELPTLMRFGRLWVSGESASDNRTDSLLEVLEMNTSGLTSCHSMFRRCKNLTSINCEWDTNNVTDMYHMFYDCTNLSTLDVSNFNISKVTSMGAMFYNCNKLTSLNVSNFNTSEVTNMDYTFSECNKLTSLDVSNFDTSKVTTMSGMFYNCHKLTSLDVSNWNTNKVTNMSHMFADCYNLTLLDTSNWNTSNVTTMSYMFAGCPNLTTLDVSNFDTSNVTTLRGMFSYAYKLASLDVSNWNTSNITDMGYTFSECIKLTSLDVSNFDTSKVTDMDGIFNNTPLLTDIGMLYCNQSTINKIASSLPTNTTQTIWVEDVDIKDLTPVEGVEFKQYAKNTEIMLTSPLLEGDKLIVKDGKLYHYHKMGKVILDGSEDEGWWRHTDSTDELSRFLCARSVFPGENKNNDGTRTSLCDTLSISNTSNKYYSIGSSEGMYILCRDIHSLDGFKQWLQANPTTVVYELASPYYELISEDPLTISLIAESSDITNSSNIPLNMTINNKGLSTVAMSSSTTYTVAFNKDTDSEVVVNLCGNEVTTTDNVVEITTPSEINDELIFYGDGVEVSNVRLLEGSVSGDSIPRESFEGLKNSFEDGYIPENVLVDFPTDIYLNGSSFQEGNGDGCNVYYHTVSLKTNTVYTVFCNINEETTCTEGVGLRFLIDPPVNDFNIQDIIVGNLSGMKGVFCSTFTLIGTLQDARNLEIWNRDTGVISISNMTILEGDWTHLTEEDFNNLGKYKVEYKVTGKNKYNKDKYPFGNGYSLANSSTNAEGLDEVTSRSEMFKLLPNTTYTYSADLTLDSNVGSAELFVLLYNDSGGVVSFNSIGIESTGRYSITFSTDSVGVYCELRFDNNFSKTGNEGIVTIDNIQLEEGTVATPYEPYKSYTKTFYLNSPLLEEDTIEDINGVATHVKRYGKVVLDGSEEWFISTVEIPDDTTLVAFKYRDVRFANSGSSITFCENYGTDTSIVIRYLTSETVRNFNHNFNNMELVIKKEKLLAEDVASLKMYLRDNPITVYCKLASPILEPISTESILCDSYVNGHLDVDTNIPIEKVQFQATSLALKYLNSNKNYKVQFDSDGKGNLDWAIGGHSNGIKENIVKGKNVFSVITGDKLNNNRLYMTGIGFNASNIQVVATDRDVDFDYFKGLQSSFEEKTAENLFDESCLSTWWLVTATNIDKTDTSGKYFSIITKAEEGKEYTIKYDYMNRYIYAFLDENYEILKGSSEISMFTTFQAPKNTKYLMCYISSNGIKEEDYDNIQVVENSENFGYEVKCKVVGKNKFDKSNVVLGYWGTDSTTYHTNIPSVFSHKTPIKVKPNTWYTMQSLGVAGNVYVVGLHPFESILVVNNSIASFYTNNRTEVYIQINTENTDLSKFLDIIQLEEGTQSTSYEPYQEYTKTIYLNSPLLKGDTIEVHNGKLCHYHKMGMVVLDGSEDEGWSHSTQYTNGIHRFRTTSGIYKSNKFIVISDRFGEVNWEGGLDTKSTEGVIGLLVSDGSAIPNNIGINLTQDLNNNIGSGTNEFKQWLQANPITMVYELAEPWYEEISPLQEDLIITSVKEGDLHIDTIVPISSKVTYNVNVQLLTDFEQSIVEQVQATQTTDLQSILDEEIDN